MSNIRSKVFVRKIVLLSALAVIVAIVIACTFRQVHEVRKRRLETMVAKMIGVPEAEVRLVCSTSGIEPRWVVRYNGVLPPGLRVKVQSQCFYENEVQRCMNGVAGLCREELQIVPKGHSFEAFRDSAHLVYGVEGVNCWYFLCTRLL